VDDAGKTQTAVATTPTPFKTVLAGTPEQRTPTPVRTVLAGGPMLPVTGSGGSSGGGIVLGVALLTLLGGALAAAALTGRVRSE
jgi:hypothetical protein